VKRPPRARAAITAREAVQAALQFHKLADDVRGERVITEWTELVGPRIAQRTARKTGRSNGLPTIARTTVGGRLGGASITMRSRPGGSLGLDARTITLPSEWPTVA
jgi:hypothetical protein